MQEAAGKLMDLIGQSFFWHSRLLNLAYPSVSMGPHVSLQKNGNQCSLFKSWTGFKVAAPSSENERIHSVLNWISPSLPLFTINDLWWRRNYPLTHTTVIISCRINAVPVESRFTAVSNRSILSDLTWDDEAFSVNIRHHLPGNPVPVDQTPVAIIQGSAFLIQSHLVSFSEASVAHLIDFL